jgi:DNA repair exonuclease SbcCD ATPase subunit
MRIRTLPAVLVTASWSVALVASLLICPACDALRGTSGSAARTKSAMSVDTVRDRALGLKTAMDRADTAFESIAERPAADLRPQFKEFDEAAKQVDERYDELHAEAKAMRDRRDTYMTEWRRQVNSLDTEELRDRAQERNRQVESDFRTVEDRMRNLERQYEPYKTRLHDLRNYLSNDLTQAGAQSVSDQAGDLRSASKRVASAADDLVETLNSLRNELASVTPVNG